VLSHVLEKPSFHRGLSMHEARRLARLLRSKEHAITSVNSCRRQRFVAERTFKSVCPATHPMTINELAQALLLATRRGAMIDDFGPTLVLLPVLASERPHARLHRVAGVVLAPSFGTLSTSDRALRHHAGL